jgi:hypothetical protein
VLVVLLIVIYAMQTKLSVRDAKMVIMLVLMEPHVQYALALLLIVQDALVILSVLNANMYMRIAFILIIGSKMMVLVKRA